MDGNKSITANFVLGTYIYVKSQRHSRLLARCTPIVRATARIRHHTLHRTGVSPFRAGERIHSAQPVHNWSLQLHAPVG